MSKLYVALYKVPIEIAEEMVALKVEAHDLAEKPNIHKEESDKYWDEVEKINEEHFFMLEKYRKR